ASKMTLGIFLPLITALIAVFETFVFRKRIALIESGQATLRGGQDKEKSVSIPKLLIAVSWLIPVGAYLALNVFTDAGTIELF
ncbi:hypothetical protein, partial [Sphingorhabdus sp.]|uniref:hypothetical protein n=1 Tax=Sphingorhabdus sp. TaxID=1902408 RepID=UPI003C710F9F